MTSLNPTNAFPHDGNDNPVSILYTVVPDSRTPGLTDTYTPVLATSYGALHASPDFRRSAAIDAFSRLRVGEPLTLFDSHLMFGEPPFQWSTQLDGTASEIDNTNASTSTLRVGTSYGDRVLHKTKRYLRYQPGKSQLIAMTGVLGARKANVRRRLGYYNAFNGVFFEQDGTDLYVVQRSWSSGPVADTRVAQADWNLDTLDGTGASGFTLDETKAQIFLIDLQWLGVGRVRLGFDIDGEVIYVHQFTNANSQATTYMGAGSLPLALEIENYGPTASASDLVEICATVISEGGVDETRGIPFATSNGVTSTTVTTRRPVLSISPRFTTLNGKSNWATLLPIKAGIVATGSGVLLEVVYNGTLTGTNWVNVSSNSLMRQDISATAISGGTVVGAEYVPAAGAGANAVGTGESSLVSTIPFTLTIDGSSSDTLSIVATALSGSPGTYGTFVWKELY